MAPKAPEDEKLRQWAQDYAELIDAGWPLPNDKQANARGLQSVTSALAIKWGLRTNRSVRARLRNAAKFSHIWEAAIQRREAADALSADPTVAAPRSASDMIEQHRQKEEIKRLKAENGDLLKRLTGAEDLRAAINGLSDPLEPVSFQQDQVKSGHYGETAMLTLSDLQWGETIDLASMDGMNSYGTEIARARLQRVFSAFVDLVTVHWAGPPPERIIIALCGDLVSGEIHDELAKTNSLLSIPALRDVAAHIAAGIRLVHEALPDVPIDILSVPGNHGRTTRKHESKGYAQTSYDTLCADVIELEFKQNGEWPSWFRMWKPVSGDALIWIYGYRVLITHGDRIGSRGGAGFVGTAATVARGFKKLVMDYAGRHITLDFIICGHFHTALQLEEGICNGCLPGPSEYSRDLRFRPRPAVQAFVSFHPRRGVTQIRWIDAGDPSEGSLYTPKEPPSPEDTKPRFRIPAIGDRT